MALMTLDDVAGISRRVVGQTDRRFSLLSVLLTRGGAGHVELLIGMKDGETDPCRYLFNVTREGAEALALELGHKLRKALSSASFGAQTPRQGQLGLRLRW